MSEHGGNIHKAKRESGNINVDFIDFSAGINPFGPPAGVYTLLQSRVRDILHYPDPEYYELRNIIAEKYKVQPENIVLGNGSSDILFALFRVLQPQRAVIPVPSYIDYAKSAELSNIPIQFHQLLEEDSFRLNVKELIKIVNKGDLLLLCSPNNPSGNLLSPEKIEELSRHDSNLLIVIDEAYLDFIPEAASVAGQYHNVFTLNSLTKFYAIPGLRLGFGIFPAEIAKRLQESIAPWAVNSFADMTGRECLKASDFTKTAKMLAEEKTWVLNQLHQFDALKVFPGQANFILIKNKNSENCSKLQEFLYDRRILIRNCFNFRGLGPQYWRIAVKSREDNTKLIESLQDYFGMNKLPKARQRRANLMFQGTSSNAGKSILTTALCRILLQDGVKVAPFKAQNMSLNSFVTGTGGEMGRAQVVQAQAAKTDPDIRMNPVLLKPNSNVGSQVIVCGKPVGNMDIFQYNRYKAEAWKKIVECYTSLEDEYDAVILEGAGSPGEINLKHDDIVNMKMAEHVQSPVILVGDIDRGGVYASFIGTYEVLEGWERALTAGFIVNKFRGEQSLLDSAHAYMKAKTDKDVFGVVPYLTDLGIPEEDSVTFKLNRPGNAEPDEPYIDIAVIDLPHISNFTDIEPFYSEPDVRLRIVKSAKELMQPDVILLPGSKNVASDLAYLKNKGLAGAILSSIGDTKEIVGICGGYMMLGDQIEDPYEIESGAKFLQGFGLLPINSILAEDKCLKRKKGIHIQSGLTVSGYEIHHGISMNSQAALFSYSDGSGCGVSAQDGKVWGCYLHGIFDDDIFRRSFIDNVRQKKGLAPKNVVVAPYDIETAFDRLAETVRQSIDMDKIYQLLGL